MINRCKAKKQKPRHRITLALDGEAWSKFQGALKERWQDSFNSWVEFAMTCYMQEICDDCPFVDEEDKGKGYKPAGIGKNSNE
jgi:hypothetical protein